MDDPSKMDGGTRMSIVGPDPTPLPRYPRGMLLLSGFSYVVIMAVSQFLALLPAYAEAIGPIGAILAIPLTLLARTFLVDSDPDIAWVRPAFGPTVETRRRMKAADVAGKNARKAKPPSSPRPTATQAPEPGYEG